MVALQSGYIFHANWNPLFSQNKFIKECRTCKFMLHYCMFLTSMCSHSKYKYLINYKGSHRTLKPSGEVFDTEAPDDGEVDLAEESCSGGGRAVFLSELVFGGGGASLVCHRKWALR